MTDKAILIYPANYEISEPGADDINLSWPERYTSIIGGVRLGISGFKHLFASPFSSIIKLSAGGYLLNRGITGHCELYSQISKYTSEPVNINIRAVVIINKPRNEVYDFWRRFDNLPLFMNHLKSVELLDDDCSRWVLRLPSGVGSVSWVAEVVKDKPNEMIGWSSLPGSMIDTAGKVRFRDTPDGESTRVDIMVTYLPPAGGFGAGIARALNPMFKKMVEKDIQNFKHYMDIDYATDGVNYL